MRWCWPILVVGCYAPAASPGSPCTSDGRCPSGLTCEAGRCVVPGSGADSGTDTSDASTAPDAALPDVPNVTCPGVFCDGFESPNLADVWTLEGGVATGAPRTGSASLAAAITDQTRVASAAVRPFGSSLGNELYARAWFYVPTASSLAHLNLLAFPGDTSGDIAVYTSQNDLRVWNSAVTDSSSSGLAIPRDRWFCIELHVTVGSAGAIGVRLDDQLVITRSNELTQLPGGYGWLLVGIVWAHAIQPETSLRVDDVVAGTQPIGCN